MQRIGAKFGIGTFIMCVLMSVPCMAQEKGILVEAVRPGSVAEQVGLKVGDRLLSYDGTALSSPFALHAANANRSDRDPGLLRLQRGVETLTVSAGARLAGLRTHPELPQALLRSYEEGLSQSNAPEQAIARWKEAAQAARASDDLRDAVWLWWTMGEFQAAHRQWKEARVSFETAWMLVKAGSDVQSHYIVSVSLGNCCAALGDLTAAHTCYEQAEQMAAAAGLAGWEGDALTAMGSQAFERGDMKGAQDYYDRSLTARVKLGADSLDVAASLNNLGRVARASGDLEAAERDYRRALEIRERRTPDSLPVANTLDSLGNVAALRGDLEGAQRYYQRALKIEQIIAPDSPNMANCLNNSGNVYEERGDLETAESCYRRALAIQEKQAPDSLPLASSLNNLGIVAQDRGDLEAALLYHQRALAIREKRALDSLPVAESLNNLGNVAQDRGDVKSAESFHRRALEIREKQAPNSLPVAESLNNLGNIARANDNLKSAESYYQRALVIQNKQAPDSLAVAESYNNLGNIASDRGRLETAESDYRLALKIKQKRAPDSLRVVGSLQNIGTTLLKEKRPHDAVPILLDAINILEMQRSRLDTPDARALLTEHYNDTYDTLMRAYLALNDPQHAFTTLERKRARALTDRIAERNIDFSADAPKELLARQQELENQRRIAYRQRSRLDPDRNRDQFAANNARLTSLTVVQRQITHQIRRQSHRYAALVYPLPLDLKQIQQVLDPGTLLLEYAVEQDESLLFAVTTNSFALYRLPLKQADMQKQVKKLRDVLSRSDSLADYLPLARQLYVSLLGPAQERLRTAQRLLICPDGPLHLLPFCALIETLPAGSKQKERFLIEARPLHTVVAMNVYGQLKQQPAAAGANALVAFGDPTYPQHVADAAPTQPGFVKMGRVFAPLPKTAGQVKAIAALYAPHAVVELGRAATLANVFKKGGTARILHFACHGLLDNRDPLASALALTPDGAGDDGMLRAYDILGKLHLCADLVVLSGCETGLGVEQKNEGIDGLTRAFEYAGAKSLAVSLWELADTSSTALMEAFYRQLKAGKPKDEALRQAQLALLHGKNVDWHEPFHWAAFQLVGDWK